MKESKIPVKSADIKQKRRKSNLTRRPVMKESNITVPVAIIKPLQRVILLDTSSQFMKVKKTNAKIAIHCLHRNPTLLDTNSLYKWGRNILVVCADMRQLSKVISRHTII